MSIETEITVTLASVDMGNEYDVLLTVYDPLTNMETTASLDVDQAAEFIEEIRQVIVEAREARAADEVDRADGLATHAFDVATPPHRPDAAQERMERIEREAHAAGWSGVGAHPGHRLLVIDGETGECSCGLPVPLS